MLYACSGDDLTASKTESPESNWATPDRSVGAIHNDILKVYHTAHANGSQSAAQQKTALKDAVLYQAAIDTEGDELIIAEIEAFFDEGHYATIEERLAETYTLVKSGHPDPESVAGLLEGWGVATDEADELGATIAFALLSSGMSQSVARARSLGSPAATVFADVLHNSAEYWTSDSSSARRIEDDSEVIIADAGGAIAGLPFGVIGSIIGAAVYSVLWNEATAYEDRNSGGGCGSCH